MKEIESLVNIQDTLALPVGAATVKHFFSPMNLIKMTSSFQISDINLARLTIEGPDL